MGVINKSYVAAKIRVLFRPSEEYPWQRYSPRMRVHLRNQVPEQRGSENEGSLFSTEEIVEDTLFLAELEFGNETEAEIFTTEFEPVLMGQSWLTLGRGGRPVEVIGSSWITVTPPKDTSVADQEGFTITLQSDLIVRASNLGFYDTLSPTVLAELTGIDLASLNLNDLIGQPFCDTVEIRGFNAATGLPRPPVLAIRRGSSLRICGSGAALLRPKLISQPTLGERTWEGFGRFRLDFNPLAESSEALKNMDKEQAQQRPGAEKAKEPGADWDEMGTAEDLLAKARELADKLPLPASGGPSKSQWQALRQGALVARDINQLIALLDELKKHATRQGGRAWQNARLSEIKKIVEGLNLEHGRLFLDTLVRWQRVRLEKRG
jgi:hypothetical protein